MDDAGFRRWLVGTRGYEWDDNKRILNITKHGIDFLDVPALFADPGLVVYRSGLSSDESRYVCIGRLQDILVAAVVTPRRDRIGIISARVARRSERDRYG